MGYRAKTYTQDSASGRIEHVLTALTEAATVASGFDAVDVAVAYASAAGVTLLSNRLAGDAWTTATKRFLVSIDFGITQPKALDQLASFPNAEVRVPNALDLLASNGLLPKRTFHPKVYIFRGTSWSNPCASIVGSANLTASALAVGSEVVVGQFWSGHSSRSDRRQLVQLKETLSWFDDIWSLSTPWKEICDSYRSLYEEMPGPPIPAEEKTAETLQYLTPTSTATIPAGLNFQYASAKSYWIHTGAMAENRGPGRPGNQLDAPRGTRVFFGFSAERVLKNYHFGNIEVRIAGSTREFVERSVRFGNNEMDKINLPIPEQYGVESYADSVLIFTRITSTANGLPRFELEVTDAPGLKARQRAASHSVAYAMTSGRKFGLMF